ncbi:MAG: peptidylprolyl isomerase [Bacteroidales bacterium]|nr:peptidylprolyl isomerase [Bacteroidales bacterium]
MKKTLSDIIILASVAIFCISCSCSNNSKEANQEEETSTEATAPAQASTDMGIKASDLPEEPVFDIATSLGTIRVKLYSKTPRHRDNFVKLALGNFYDGILFHRVINGFMIQAGDPLTKDPANADMFGTGGPGYTVPAEFVNEYYHKKGALAAARRGDAANPKKASSGSQFYLVQDEMACLPLDGEYTVFGETVNGLDVIDKIAAVPTDRHDRPIENVAILSITPVLE